MERNPGNNLLSKLSAAVEESLATSVDDQDPLMGSGATEDELPVRQKDSPAKSTATTTIASQSLMTPKNSNTPSSSHGPCDQKKIDLGDPVEHELFNSSDQKARGFQAPPTVNDATNEQVDSGENVSQTPTNNHLQSTGNEEDPATAGPNNPPPQLESNEKWQQVIYGRTPLHAWQQGAVETSSWFGESETNEERVKKAHACAEMETVSLLVSRIRMIEPNEDSEMPKKSTVPRCSSCLSTLCTNVSSQCLQQNLALRTLSPNSYRLIPWMPSMLSKRDH